MKILDSCVAVLTNAEVLDIIDDDLASAPCNGPDFTRRRISNTRIVKYMSTLQIFLYKRSAEECLADLVSLYPQLSEADLVQLVNLVPRQQVEAFLCIEDCDLRFTEAEVEEILKVINSHVPESSIPSPLPSPA